MKIQRKTQKIFRPLSIFVLIGAISLQALLQSPAYAAGQITKRSLTLQANGLNGGSAPGVPVNHLFTFTVPTGGNVGSVKFEYCTTAADVGAATCVSPPGMNAATATLTSGTGIDGMTIDSANQNVVILRRSNTNNVAANTIVTYQFSNVTNPQAKKADTVTDEPNYTFYVRISTYGSLDATGLAIDKGTVTASTADPIRLSGTMPESLIFCTGESVPFKMDESQVPAVPTTIPNCAAATPGIISFNQLFDPTMTASALSQMAASTNAGYGYVITVNGSTLKSGDNQINPMVSSAFPIAGVSQFGLNLKANDNTYLGSARGAEVTPLPSESDATHTYRGQAINGYDVVNNFKFVSGDGVANSYNNYTEGAPGATAATDGQIFTVTYMANVPGSQPAGDYSTTLTYICTPTY